MYKKIHCVSVYLVGCVLRGLNRIAIVSLLQQSDDASRGLQITGKSFLLHIHLSIVLFPTTFPCPVLFINN